PSVLVVTRPPPLLPLFPYTPLFRSGAQRGLRLGGAVEGGVVDDRVLSVGAEVHIALEPVRALGDAATEGGHGVLGRHGGGAAVPDDHGVVGCHGLGLLEGWGGPQHPVAQFQPSNATAS